MTTPGPSALPVAGSDGAGVDLPDLDRLRIALRPAELPLPHPRDVREAAARVSDLVHAERAREARALAEGFRSRPAPLVDRHALLRASLQAARALGDAEQVRRDAADLVSLLHRNGCPEQAAATAAVLLEQMPAPGRTASSTRAAVEARALDARAPDACAADTRASLDSRAVPEPAVQSTPGPAQGAATGPAPRGRRRGRSPQPTPEMTSVVGALAFSAGLGTERGIRPLASAARLRRALAVLSAVRERLLVDPEPELRLRLAQLLEAAGDAAGATTAALDVLELIEQSEQRAWQEQEALAGTALVNAWSPAGSETDARSEIDARSETDVRSEADRRSRAAAEHGAAARIDPARTATAARAVLARTLAVEHPVDAVHHAVDALEMLHEVEDPPLRIGLITALLQALMAAGATRHASFTAGRLASLQRTLTRDVQRIAPLLAVAAQRFRAERWDAALVPLEQARRIAREHRDHRGLLEAARLGASLHERTGEGEESLRELRRLAGEARWLADDLETTAAARGELIRTELGANALVLRRGLDLGRHGTVAEAAREIERRTRPEDAPALLPPELLWDHRVDARVGLFIAAGDALARGIPGADETLCEQRRREAMQAVDEMPPGHDQRARYWAAYLDDRHAHLLAERGRLGPARRAARRAKEGWKHLGLEEDVARTQQLLDSLTPD